MSKPPILPTTTTNAVNGSTRTHIRLTTPSRFGQLGTTTTRGYASLPQDSPPPSAGLEGEEGDIEDTKKPLTARLKILIKSYGWYAIGVYIAIGLVDFSVAFAAVNFFGAEQVGHVVTYVKGAVLDLFHGGISSEDSPDGAVNGRESVHAAGSSSEGIYAMILLAYTVHKTLFMPLRVGLTVGYTPKLVRWLRSRGWTGQGGATRAAGHLRQTLRRRGDRID